MPFAQQLVSPKQAAAAIGVSESSLKRWCDSGLLRVTRTAGGHRKIAIGEVLRFASQNGATVVAPDVFSLSIPPESQSSKIEDIPSRLADALLSGNETAARQIVFGLFLANHPISSICDQVFAPAFHDIGYRWSCRSTKVYQERRGCEIIAGILHELRRVIPPFSTGPLALGGTISGDSYELPSAMTELVLRSAGYDARNLGTSIPTLNLAEAVRDLRPALFWLSVSHIQNEVQFVEEFSELSSACSATGVSLVVGGRALNEKLRCRLKYSAYCDTMKHLEAFAQDLKRWSSKPLSAKRSRRASRANVQRTDRPNAFKRKRKS